MSTWYPYSHSYWTVSIAQSSSLAWLSLTNSAHRWEAPHKQSLAKKSSTSSHPSCSMFPSSINKFTLPIRLFLPSVSNHLMHSLRKSIEFVSTVKNVWNTSDTVTDYLNFHCKNNWESFTFQQRSYKLNRKKTNQSNSVCCYSFRQMSCCAAVTLVQMILYSLWWIRCSTPGILYDELHGV